MPPGPQRVDPFNQRPGWHNSSVSLCSLVGSILYMALSVLPLVVRNAPYQTVLASLLQACVSLIRVSYIILRRLMQRSLTIWVLIDLIVQVQVAHFYIPNTKVDKDVHL